MDSSRIARILLTAALAGLAACGSPTAVRQAPPARIERTGHGGVPSVVLSPVGQQRIGLRTARAVPAGQGSSTLVIPYAALLYEADGSTVVYTVTGQRIYTKRTVMVIKIAGNRVYLRGGLTPGTQVVTDGAEELLGVQDGVGVQT